MPLVSICIPAYKRVDGLRRLLNSIITQKFTDYEIIVTDDSGDESVCNLIEEMKLSDKLMYIKNEAALGSPANWNKAISMASGKWIKLMHDDDWFRNERSLQWFANGISNDSNLIFSAYTNVDVADNSIKKSNFNFLKKLLLYSSPYNLFEENFIGHPSTTLIKNDQDFWFDEKVKWVVDFEFYIRLLKRSKKFVYIKTPEINIGISNTQVTKQAFRNAGIEIPENLYLLNKLGSKILKNIFVYDYYWRLFRNLSIRSISSLNNYCCDVIVPKPVINIINQQKKIPQPVLNIGLFSKTLMLASYCRNLIIK